MISVSSISEYVYCPAKMYLKYTQDNSAQTQEMIAGKISQEIRRGYEEITKRNIWNIKENVEIDDIFGILFDEIPQFIENTSNKYYKMDIIDPTNLDELCVNLNENFKLESQFMALKIKSILNNTKKRGMEIAEMFYPQSLLEFSLKNEELNLSGKVDKIEIINGIYYPIETKTGIPPGSGVWLADALQIAAYAILIDYELNKEVLVGFIDYIKIGERRPVVINSILHNKLFGVLDSINGMFEKQEMPEFKIFRNKCEKCEYNEICEYYG
ncbi:CRISPR-associated protein Cas4 [Methanobacterium oryzae]|uniref:CRISPR-associated protein Cas4 n=1 Tax=Methanobacterium oryzae TaxID=69540 RepID=UPI003D1EFDB9